MTGSPVINPNCREWLDTRHFFVTRLDYQTYKKTYSCKLSGKSSQFCNMSGRASHIVVKNLTGRLDIFLNLCGNQSVLRKMSRIQSYMTGLPDINWLVQNWLDAPDVARKIELIHALLILKPLWNKLTLVVVLKWRDCHVFITWSRHI